MTNLRAREPCPTGHKADLSVADGTRPPPQILPAGRGPTRALRAKNGGLLAACLSAAVAWGQATGAADPAAALGQGLATTTDRPAAVAERGPTTTPDDMATALEQSRATMMYQAAPARAWGRDASTDDPAVPSAPPGSAQDEPEEDGWSFSASAYTYLVPDDRDYLQPTFAADHGWLHLEARYNYEDMDTGSAWIGATFSGGEALAWEITPIAGGVFGETDGIAAGYKGSLGWWKLELYSEGEYVHDTGASSDSFFYNWSELTLAPVDWFRFGVVTQRTRVYETDRDIQRGILAGFSYKGLDLTAHVFNPDNSDPTWVLAAALNF